MISLYYSKRFGIIADSKTCYPRSYVTKSGNTFSVSYDIFKMTFFKDEQTADNFLKKISCTTKYKKLTDLMFSVKQIKLLIED